MTAAARRAVSPYARSLARQHTINLSDLRGSGPGGRIVAADILAWRPPEPPPAPLPAIAAPAIVTFAATVALGPLTTLIADLARSGHPVGLDDIALRAARHALADLSHGVALETATGEILSAPPPGLSVSAERRLRTTIPAPSVGTAIASLLILPASRAMPLAFPLLPGHALRFVLGTDPTGTMAHALLCADGATVAPAQAAAILDAFATHLEDPLILLA